MQRTTLCEPGIGAFAFAAFERVVHYEGVDTHECETNRYGL